MPVVDLVSADILYARFPERDEGFLTEMRARMVNTRSLDRLARAIGLHELLLYDKKNHTLTETKTIFADALEALIGAVYLDHGFESAYDFVASRLFGAHVNLSELEQTEQTTKAGARVGAENPPENSV